MQKSLIFFSVIFLLGNQLFSQVNVQAGSAQFDIPVFNFSDGKSGLSHQVSISYSSGSGLKINDLPSGVGQGWQLLCGGSVVRKQNGEPDDQNSTNAFPVVAYNNTRVFNQEIAVWNDNYQSFNAPGDCYSRDYVENYYPNGYLYSEFPLDITENYPLRSAAPRELGFLPRFKDNMDKRYKLSKRALTDRQQDIFIFSINGISGEFVIGKDGTIVTLADSKLKIEKFESNMTASNIRTRINSFKITDDNGMIYTFGAMSLSEVLNPKEISNTGGDFSFSTSGNDASGKYTVDQWGITSIKNPFTNEEIIFNYAQIDIDYIGQRLPSFQFMEHDNKENVNLHEIRIKGKLKKIQSIIFPNGHSVEINYNGFRQDVSNDPRIADIQIKYNNSLVNKFVLNHSYLFKKEVRGFSEIFAETDKRFLRLSLTSVQRQAPDGTIEPPYEFTYNTGIESAEPTDIVPPTDSYSQDHWGYYSKISIADINQPIPSKETFRSLVVAPEIHRNPSYGSCAKFGLLKSIKNPAKGEITYDYEQNTQVVTTNGQASTSLTGGVHVSALKQYDGISHSNDIITNYSYTLDNSLPSAWGYESPNYFIRRDVQIIKDNLNYKYGGAQVTNISGSLQQMVLKQVAGAIVKKVVKQAAAEIAKKAAAEAVANGVSQTAASSFWAGVGPQVIIWGYVYTISKAISYLYLLLNPYDYDRSYNYQFYPLNYNNPIGNHFSRVVISNGSSANGKIVQEFSKPTDISTEIKANNFPYSEKQRYARWEFDLLKRQAVYDNTKILSETFYNYNIFKKELSGIPATNTTNFLSSKVEPNYLRSARWEAASYNFPVSDLSTDFYYPITGRTEVSSTTQKNYSNTGILSETNATVQYNNDYLPNISTVTKSNGDQIITKTYYSNDYNNSVSPAIALLKSKNAIALPIATETWLKKAVTNQEFLIDASVSEFVVLPNNDIKIGKVYGLENKEPIAKSIILDWNANTLIRNATYLKLQQEFIYNADGNLAQTVSKGGEISSNIYDYNKRLTTAVVSNAPITNVAYTSFESDNTGGWSYAASAVLNNIDRTPTGNKCYPLNNNSGIWSNITLNRDYILSFWAKTDAGVPAVFSSATLLKTVAVNDWTYFEYKLPQGTVNPGLSGQGIIDEIRLYPDNAKMATTTYDPAKGKTSECDINNRILYYEYDGLGRMVRVKDEKRNLIKTYEYHFKN
jgi:hypothetical protein